MNIIDTDLLSVQEARVKLDIAKNLYEDIKFNSQTQFDVLLKEFCRLVKDNIDDLLKLEFEEINNGNIDHEKKLIFHMLNDFEKNSQKQYLGILEAKENEEFTRIGISKGTAVLIGSPFLVSLTTLHTILLAIKTASPLIIIPDKRALETNKKIIKLIDNIYEKHEYAHGLIQVLENVTSKGIEELVRNKNISLIIEAYNIKYLKDLGIDPRKYFKASIGNSPVFIEHTANLEKAAKEIIYNKSYCNGLLPGVEQSIVVETIVEDKMRQVLKENGAYFLTDDEAQRLEKVLYDKNKNPILESCGKSALELAKRSNINVPKEVKILVVNKPFVSITSPYSKEKYFPVISFYAEDNWMSACEKCIELLLNNSLGASLGIYSEEESVVNEFLLKKPVAKLLINTGLALGSTGVTSNLPLSYSLASVGEELGDQSSLNENHFIYYKCAAYKVNDNQIKITNENKILEKNNTMVNEKQELLDDFFKDLLELINPNK